MEQMKGSRSSGGPHSRAPRYAPSYELPSRAVVSIEHPFIIRNMDKAIETLGGALKMQALAQEETQGSLASLYLRPDDAMCKPILSHNVPTNNIVLQITVPKRTGLRRRRGAISPFYEVADQTGNLSLKSTPSVTSLASGDTRQVIRSLRDNDEKYKILPVGFVYQTHRFRSMPDFVYSTTKSPFMKKMRENILPFEYEKLKNFKFDMSKGPRPNIDLIPPPRWSHITIPYNYSYLQNASVKQMIDDHGIVTSQHNQKPPSVQNQPIPHNEPIVPSGPVEDLPPIAALEPAMQRLIASAQLLLEERPLWTRRALRNRVSTDDWDQVGNNAAKYLYQYIGYSFDSGPWRDAIVKFGVDPRKDPDLRIYQTMMFILDKEYNDSRRKKTEYKTRTTLNKQTSRDTHIFDGLNVSLDGKVWQICDVTDSLLKNIFSTSNIRDECHIQGDGWYHSGTLAKARTIMKAKITSILAGQIPNNDDFVRVINELPEIIDDYNLHLARFPKNSASPQEIRLAAQVRTNAKKYQTCLGHRQSQTQESLSFYGYRRHDNEPKVMAGRNKVQWECEDVEDDDLSSDEELDNDSRFGDEEEIEDEEELEGGVKDVVEDNLIF